MKKTRTQSISLLTTRIGVDEMLEFLQGMPPHAVISFHITKADWPGRDSDQLTITVSVQEES